MMKFEPFAQMTKMFETWQKMADESAARAGAFYAEMAKAEAKRVERADAAIDEIARFQKETLAYGMQLGAELRKMSLEAFQQATSLATSTTAS
jgi:hypothetical protein